MKVTARADYAVRATLELAQTDGPLKGEVIATAQDIPLKYLENILGDLRMAGIVRSRRGANGGYRLARDPSTIAVADVVRAVEGPLATVRGVPAEELDDPAAHNPLQTVWIATRAALRQVLEETTLADVASGTLPATVQALAADPGAWESTEERAARRLRR
jgi:Rrf2 family protein